MSSPLRNRALGVVGVCDRVVHVFDRGSDACNFTCHATTRLARLKCEPLLLQESALKDIAFRCVFCVFSVCWQCYKGAAHASSLALAEKGMSRKSGRRGSGGCGKQECYVLCFGAGVLCFGGASMKELVIHHLVDELRIINHPCLPHLGTTIHCTTV